MDDTAPSIAFDEKQPRRRRFWHRKDRTMVIPVVMAGYAGLNAWKRYRRPLLWFFGFVAFIYGALFSLFTTFIMLQLATPLFAMLLLIVWLLPNTGRAPTRMLTRFFFIFLIAVICWPNYLAIALPGMPWITIIRLVTVPLATIMLISLSTSSKFRGEAKAIIDAVPAVWKLLVGFSIIALFSIAVSREPGESANKFVVAQLSWTLIFFASTYVFAQPGNARRLCYTLWYCVLFVSVLAAQEWRHAALPWAPYIPSFLKVDTDSVQNVLAGGGRAATGMYRVKSVFTTPLGLAEYLAFAVPFIWFIALNSRRWSIRIAALATIPAVFAILISTDSRLGMIGFFQTILLYVFLWGLMRWRDYPEGFAGRLVLAIYPLLAGGFFVLSLVWTRLTNMIWGGGATLPSTLARKAQVASGIPMVFKAPWGHGIGQGGATLGYIGSGGTLTIDTYYLAVALEYGVIGFVVYFGMFIAAIVFGLKALWYSKDDETRLLIPLIIALANFTVIKSVFSQESNHPIVFCLLGALVALVYRVQGTAGHTKRVQEQLAGKRLILPGRRPVLAHAKVRSLLP